MFFYKNKAGYTATPVGCGWAGAIFEVSRVFGQEQHSQKPNKQQKSSVMDGPMDRQTKFIVGSYKNH